jgi:hypothetical protein
MAAGQAEHTSPATPITDPTEAEKMAEAFCARYGTKNVRYGTKNVQTYDPAANVAVEVPAAEPTREPPT